MQEHREISKIQDAAHHTGLHLVCVTPDSERPQLLLARLGGQAGPPAETQFSRSPCQVLTCMSYQHL